MTTTIPPLLESTATFSPCRTWRYRLTRVWDKSLPTVMFVGLNPSTADETKNDPTVRRCIGYALDWGYGGLVMTNAFGFRSTDPAGLKTIDDPVGPGNNRWLRKLSAQSAMTVVAWGIHGTLFGREAKVLSLLKDPHCLRITKAGRPSHPLYLPKHLKPIPYRR